MCYISSSMNLPRFLKFLFLVLLLYSNRSGKQMGEEHGAP